MTLLFSQSAACSLPHVSAEKFYFFFVIPIFFLFSLRPWGDSAESATLQSLRLLPKQQEHAGLRNKGGDHRAGPTIKRRMEGDGRKNEQGNGRGTKYTFPRYTVPHHFSSPALLFSHENSHRCHILAPECRARN